MTRPYPPGDDDEHVVLLGWLQFERDAVVSKLEGLDEAQARLIPIEGANSILGLIKHLTVAEQRWIDGAMLGGPVPALSEEEFAAEETTSIEDLVAAYRRAGRRTDDVALGLDLSTPCARRPERSLRWALVHLIEETARHAGHADIARQWIDGAVGV